MCRPTHNLAEGSDNLVERQCLMSCYDVAKAVFPRLRRYGGDGSRRIDPRDRRNTALPGEQQNFPGLATGRKPMLEDEI